MSRTRLRNIRPPGLLDLRQSLTPKVVKRFMKFVGDVTVDGCWPWTGHKDQNGYGQFWINGRAEWAHRVGHAIYHGGKIRAGREIDHTRRCKLGASCVCPWHTRKLTPLQNATDGGLRRWGGGGNLMMFRFEGEAA